MKQTFYEELGQRLGELRRRRQFSQERLAELANIAASYVAHIEAGTRMPTLDVISRLADALDVEGWKLIAGESRSLEDDVWQSAARKLAAEVHDLSPSDVDLLATIAKRLKDDPKPMKAKRKP